MSILEKIKTINWTKFNGSWSPYQLEIKRIILNHPNGFPDRQSVIALLNDADVSNWDFFCAAMFWGGVSEENFNRMFIHKLEITEKINEIIKIYSNQLDKDHTDWEKIEKSYFLLNPIGGLGVSFLTKVLYFIGLKFKDNFSDYRPFIYDGVMTKNLCFIYLSIKNEGTNNLNIFNLDSALKIDSFQLNKNRKNISIMTPANDRGNNIDNYKAFIKFLYYLSEQTGKEIDLLDEQIFGVNDKNDHKNFRNFMLSDMNHLLKLISPNKSNA
jgi:hypothetical protein